MQLTHNKPVMKPAKGTRKCNCRQEMVTRQWTRRDKLFGSFNNIPPDFSYDFFI